MQVSRELSVRSPTFTTKNGRKSIVSTRNSALKTSKRCARKASRVREAKALAALQVEKVGIEGQREVAEADLGPVRYLATLLGADSETALRWFGLVVALLPDRAAALRLLAATSARR